MLGRLVILPIVMLVALAAGCAGTRPQGAATPPAGKVLIEYQWTSTDAAHPPAGFLVARSHRVSGPFIVLNEQPILPPAKPAPGDRFVLMTDYGHPIGSTVYYYLDAVDRQGMRRKVSPVAAVTVTTPIGPGDERGLKAARQTAQQRAREGKVDAKGAR